RSGVAVDITIEALGSELRLAGLERAGEQRPLRISQRVEVIDEPADIRRPSADEIALTVRGIRIEPMPISVEQAERNERVKEIARAALVDLDLGAQRHGIERSLSECREDTELNRAEQRLRFFEGVAHAQDAVGCGQSRVPHLFVGLWQAN